MAEADDSDLSDYEKQRLANIKRNEAMLKSLGLQNVLSAKVDFLAAKQVKQAARQKARDTASRKRARPLEPPVRARASKRLRSTTKPDYTGENVVGGTALTASAGRSTVAQTAAKDSDGNSSEDDDEEDASIDYSEMPSDPSRLGAAL
jgi:hypothetical protein